MRPGTDAETCGANTGEHRLERIAARTGAVSATGVDIRAVDLARVWGVLRGVLPSRARVWVFGSRARGAARPASDLDLAVDAGRPLTRGEFGALADAFEESDLPYRVDVADLHAVSPSFLARIMRDKTPLPPDAVAAEE